jgi:hypothetical protein
MLDLKKLNLEIRYINKDFFFLTLNTQDFEKMSWQIKQQEKTELKFFLMNQNFKCIKEF